MDNSDKWTHIVEGNGNRSVEEIYQSVLKGNSKPDEGFILSLWDVKNKL